MKNSILVLSMLTFAAVTQSCKEEGCIDPSATNYNESANKDDGSCEYPAPTYQTKLMFEPKYGTADFDYNTTFTDGSGNAVKFSRLNFYISSPNINGMDGEEIFNAPSEAFLFTMENKTFDLGEIETDYTHWHSLKFNLGIPENLNTSSGADAKDPSEYDSEHPLSFQTPSMHWGWNSGYIFLAVEGMVDVDGDQQLDSLVKYHIGMNSNLVAFDLTAHQDVSGNATDFHVNVDVEQLFDGIDMSSERITMTMDNMPLANKVVANIPNALSLEGH